MNLSAIRPYPKSKPSEAGPIWWGDDLELVDGLEPPTC